MKFFKHQILFSFLGMLSILLSHDITAQIVTKRQQYIAIEAVKNYCAKLNEYSHGLSEARFIIENLFETSENRVYNLVKDEEIIPLKEFLDNIFTSKIKLDITISPELKDLYYFNKSEVRYGQETELLLLVLQSVININDVTKTTCFIINTGNSKLVNVYKTIPDWITLKPVYEIEKTDEDVKKIVEKYNDTTEAKQQYLLGMDYLKNKQYQEAFKWFQLAAEKDNPEAMNKLGELYREGFGTDQDFQKAIFWFRKAAESNNTDAKNNMGFMYDRGLGVSQNFNEALKWYQSSGTIKGDIYLGVMYTYGFGGVVKDLEKALSLIKKASDAGDDDGIIQLGFMYYSGLGVEQDVTEAVKIWRKAADKGNPTAQANIGDAYYSGIGTEQNYEEALKWYKKSADQGCWTGQNGLGNVYKNGLGVEKNYTEALKWYRKSADQGLPAAQYNIGYMFENGLGTDTNKDEAVLWYKRAAKSWDPDAINRLNELNIK